MWVFPLLASGVAFVFAGRLFADYARRRQPYQLAWAIALAMYGGASFVVVLGGLDGWSDREFAVYWALGAVLNVPFLAGGELMLLVRNEAFRWAVWLVLIFLTAHTVTTLNGAEFSRGALAERLPSGQGAEQDPRRRNACEHRAGAQFDDPTDDRLHQGGVHGGDVHGVETTVAQLHECLGHGRAGPAELVEVDGRGDGRSDNQWAADVRCGQIDHPDDADRLIREAESSNVLR